jgi:hypothetical protein
MAGRSTLVKLVLTSIVTYYITVLDIPMEILMKIDAIIRAFLRGLAKKLPEENARSIGTPCANPQFMEALGF